MKRTSPGNEMEDKELKRTKENEENSKEELVLKDGFLDRSNKDMTHSFIIKTKCKSFIEESQKLEPYDEESKDIPEMVKDYEILILEQKILVRIGIRAEKLELTVRKNRGAVGKRKKSYQMLITTEANPINLEDKKVDKKVLTLQLKMYTEDAKTPDIRYIYITVGKGKKVNKVSNIMIFPEEDHQFVINGVFDLGEFHSKRTQEYAGLVNNGMTCYMNSLLQTLYQIKEIPRNIFSLPYEEYKDKEDVGNWKSVFAFQCLYYHMLSNKNRAAETRILTDAFGWNSAEVFTQQDVQEFSCLLLDSFEKKCDISKKRNFIRELFRGEIENYIQCCDVNYRSSRNEHFYDIQLPIKDRNNIFESFDAYTEEEDLKGDNKYDAGQEYGKQDAVKGLKFRSLPPILLLHLRRFEYDFHLDRNVKITTKHDLSESINLSKYVKDSKENNSEWDFELFGILTHQGSSAGSGHYITFIRPEMGNWYKFNDEYVSNVSFDYVKKYAEGGGSEKPDFNLKTQELKLKEIPCSSTAYMLVYIKKSEISGILGKIDEEKIPQYIKDSVQKQVEEEERRVFFNKNIEVFITNSQLLENNEGLGCIIEEKGLYNEDAKNEFFDNPKKRLSVVLELGDTLNDFLAEIEEECNLDYCNFGLFVYDYDKKKLRNLLTTTNFKNRKTLKIEKLFKNEIKNKKHPILFIEPFNPKFQIFEEIRKSSMQEERKFSQYLKANEMRWSKVEASEEDLKGDEELAKNLRSSKSSLILTKTFNGENVLLTSARYYSKSDQIDVILKNEGLKDLPIFFEKYNKEIEKIELVEVNLANEIKDYCSSNGMIVKAEKAEDVDKLTEFYDNVSNRVLIKIENKEDKSSKVIISDLRKSTSTVRIIILLLPQFS